MSLTSWIAKLGVNPTFIAQNAHCWFAYSVLITAHLLFPDLAFAWLALPALALAAIKEFWFDASNEVPKQTFADNATDFSGYVLGVVLSAVVGRWLA
jgi:hypothetical protein